jgi:hypothetical protein
MDPWAHWHGQRRYAVRRPDPEPEGSRGDEWVFWGVCVLCALAIVWRFLP